jgi:uncharacterized protein YaiE (UPF0345 family)
MNSVRTDMEGAFGAFIAEQREQPGECTVTLYQFHHDGLGLDLKKVYEDCPLAIAPPLRLIPGGRTPLLDAMGTVLTRERARYEALPAARRPHPVVVVITDGAENISREWTPAGVRALTGELQDAGWLFTYLGANQDAFAVAGSLGIARDATMDWHASAAGTCGSVSGMSSMVSRTRSAYASNADPVEVHAAFSYTPGERSDAGGSENA